MFHICGVLALRDFAPLQQVYFRYGYNERVWCLFNLKKLLAVSMEWQMVSANLFKQKNVLVPYRRIARKQNTFFGLICVQYLGKTTFNIISTFFCSVLTLFILRGKISAPLSEFSLPNVRNIILLPVSWILFLKFCFPNLENFLEFKTFNFGLMTSSLSKIVKFH